MNDLQHEIVTKRTNSVQFYSYEVVRILEIKYGMVVARGCREGCNGYGVSVWEGEKSSGDGRWWVVVHNVNVLNAPELHT